MISHSQCGEDLWILETLKPPIGTFCEVGAFDGVLSSNTLVFEELGWTGFLVEPDPENAAKCYRNRRCKTFCCAAGKEGISSFHINLVDRGLSGLVGDCASDCELTVPVVVKPLWELAEAANMRKINFLSIDTEGTELEVWETIPAILPDIVLMEYNTCGKVHDRPIIERLTGQGYKLVERTTYNLIFVLAGLDAKE